MTQAVAERDAEPDLQGGATAAPLERVFDRSVAAALVLCAALYAVFIWRPSFEFRGTRYFTIFDDAVISLTYARNIADGAGAVWNPGGARVEGYTNPLWTVVMAAIEKLGLSAALVPLAISLLSAALVLGAAALAACLARRLAPTARRAPLLAALFVGLYYPLVYWALRGMEVGLITFLVLAAALLGERLRTAFSGRDLAVLCAVMAAGLLTRDDFVVPAGVVGIWLMVVLRGRDRVVAFAALAGTGAVAVGGQLAFRLSYYGEPLPNTYYLKVAGQPVGPRLWRGLMTLLAVALADLVFVVGFVVAGRRAATKRSSFGALAGLCVALIAALAVYSVYVGGDAWEWARLANRYLTPAGVLLLVLAASVVEPLAERVRTMRRGWFALAVVVIGGLTFGLVDAWFGVLFHDLIGEHLGVTPTGSDVATITAVVVVAALAIAFVVGGRRKLPPALAQRRVLVPVLAAAVLLAAVGNAWISWAKDGGFYTARNQGATAYGLVLGDITEPGASIAVIWAGAPIYYAQRNGVDLLGKMDPVIAHGPHHPGVPMYPGHDKFDFDHSIGEMRPDVIAQYAWFTDADIDRFLADGYTPMRFAPGTNDDLTALDVPRMLLWVRNDSKLVDRSDLQPVPIDEARRISIEPR
jgi:hypothetical protein